MLWGKFPRFIERKGDKMSKMVADLACRLLWAPFSFDKCASGLVQKTLGRVPRLWTGPFAMVPVDRGVLALISTIRGAKWCCQQRIQPGMGNKVVLRYGEQSGIVREGG